MTGLLIALPLAGALCLAASAALHRRMLAGRRLRTEAERLAAYDREAGHPGEYAYTPAALRAWRMSVASKVLGAGALLGWVWLLGNRWKDVVLFH